MTFPRIDGSTSSWPLRMVLVCRALGCPYEWYATSQGPMAFDFTGARGAFEQPPVDTTVARHIVAADRTRGRNRLAAMINTLIVKSSGTHGSWENLGKKETDLIIAARPPSDKEIAEAGKNGVKYEYKPVAMGAFVFIVNRVNPVESLTLEQIRGIYTGKITDWKNLGGRAGKITAYQRNPDSGSQPLMEKLVMQGQEIKKPLRREIAYSMAGPYNQLHLDASGISYSVYYYDRFMTPSALTRTLKIGGVAPSNRTIADGSYPVVSKVWAGIRAGQAKDGATRKLYDWLSSNVGQAVIAEAGYVPITRIDSSPKHE
jgi:phosphate transport system substrate-binding protein